MHTCSAALSNFWTRKRKHSGFLGLRPSQPNHLSIFFQVHNQHSRPFASSNSIALLELIACAFPRISQINGTLVTFLALSRHDTHNPDFRSNLCHLPNRPLSSLTGSTLSFDPCHLARVACSSDA